jgi:hypothetical protein
MNCLQMAVITILLQIRLFVGYNTPGPGIWYSLQEEI